MARAKQEKPTEDKQENPPVGDGFIRWSRPSGTQIETNDLAATIEACELAGWKRA